MKEKDAPVELVVEVLRRLDKAVLVGLKTAQADDLTELLA